MRCTKSTILICAFVGAWVLSAERVCSGEVKDVPTYEVNFGNVLSGEVKPITTKIRNPSNHAVKVLKCESSCGCTKVDPPAKPDMNAKGEMDIRMQVDGRG